MKVKIPFIFIFSLIVVSFSIILGWIDLKIEIGYFIGYTLGFLYCFYFYLKKVKGEAEK
ncbi:MAG: hypothetical protein QXG39_06265 [Candidatus Aenigmatarchaeota archaeon]